MPTPLSSKIDHVLTEARMVLPGTQALLGFQFSIVLMEAFDRLPRSLKLIHLVSCALVALSAVWLIAPAAYHRIVERGEDTPHFHDLAAKMLLSAMAALAAGICGDYFVVARKITGSFPVALAGAIALFALFGGLWFAFPVWRSRRAAGAREA